MIRLFSNVFIRKNRITCLVNDAEKNPFFFVRARSCVHLNDPDVFNRSVVNDSSLVTIAPNQVSNKVTSNYLHDPAIFVVLL